MSQNEKREHYWIAYLNSLATEYASCGRSLKLDKEQNDDCREKTIGVSSSKFVSRYDRFKCTARGVKGGGIEALDDEAGKFTGGVLMEADL